jgi:hypothetical protein
MLSCIRSHPNYPEREQRVDIHWVFGLLFFGLQTALIDPQYRALLTASGDSHELSSR